MARIFICLLITFILSPAVSAQHVDSNLVTRYRPGIMWFYGGLRPSKLVDAKKYDRFVIDLLYNDWSQTPKLFRHASIGWNVQLFFDIPLTKRNAIALGIGLGYGHTRIHYDEFLDKNDNERITTLEKSDLIAGFQKSVFKSNKLFVPVELRFRTPGWKHFKFHLGGKVGYQFLTSSKLYTNLNGDKATSKTRRFHDVNPLLLSVHAKIGIRNWALTASYNLTPYFKNKASTQLNGLELGLSISLF